MRQLCSLLVTLVLVGSAATANAALVLDAFNGRVPCVPTLLGQLCSSAGTVFRVETWDGVPLDVTLVLPPPQLDGPFPLIVDLHGFGAGKTPGELFQLAPQGYAVLIYSARGQHFSCGFPESRAPDPTLSNPNACTERGWFHLADVRYEVRDTQYLTGLLVDDGLVLPDIGVTGSSFGGGQSLMLAALKNRMVLADGTYVPWESPGGVPMSIAAAAPLIGWSDLAYALVPNGRTLDFRALNPYLDLGVSERAGVMKESWVNALYAVGLPSVFYAPAGADPDADIDAWRNRMLEGEPYDADPLLRHALEQLTTYHSAYYLDDSVEPAPLWIYDAWTDDIMPPVQALKYYNKTKSLYPGADISLQFADHFAHPRGNLASPSRSTQTDRVIQHLTLHLSGAGTATPPVEVYTQACNGSTETGPHTAADWDALRPGEVRHADAAPQTFDAAGGDPLAAAVDDPVGVTAPLACRTLPTSADDPGAATYRMPVVGCSGYTLVGSPTVIAEIAVTGDVAFAQIASRLWDVAPNGSQSLVTHGLYRTRLDNLGPQVFQLEPNGWEFAVGHQPKLELLGQSAPYGRASNGAFDITVSDLELRLPVLEAPDGCIVDAPAPPILPPGDVEGPTPTPAGTPAPSATPAPSPTMASQPVLGKKLQIKDPSVAAKHKIVALARERDSDDVLDGDPVANGARLRIVTRGGTSWDQTFDLPKEGWRARGTQGFKYSNRVPGGAVRKVLIKRSKNGTFQIRALIRGKDGPVMVVPPNPGDDGGFILTITGGGSYCTGFGSAAGGQEKKDDATHWLVAGSKKFPTAEACPVPPGMGP